MNEERKREREERLWEVVLNKQKRGFVFSGPPVCSGSRKMRGALASGLIIIINSALSPSQHLSHVTL